MAPENELAIRVSIFGLPHPSSPGGTFLHFNRKLAHIHSFTSSIHLIVFIIHQPILLTMKTTATILALGASALAQTVHQVTVDAQFSPDSLTDVAQGDIIQFNFQGTHSVATSDFSSPCKTGGNPVIYSDNVNAVSFVSSTQQPVKSIWHQVY